MIKHLCLIKYKDPAAVDAALQSRVESIYQNFVALVPGLRRMEVGRDLGLLDGNYDLGICAEFETEEDFRTYSVHPAHMETLFPVLGPVMESWTTLQFKLK